MDFEEAIVAGIVEQFFQSRPGSTDQYGTVTWTPPPALNMALHLFDKRKDEILAAVSANLDVDTLAAKIAQRVADDLEPKPHWMGDRGSGLRDAIRAAVIDKIAQAQADQIRAEMEATDGT